MWSKFEQREFPSRCNVIKALDSEPKRFYAGFPIALAPQKTAKASGVLNYQNYRLLIDPVNRGFIIDRGILSSPDLESKDRGSEQVMGSPPRSKLRGIRTAKIKGET